jgi:hypothetical protein
MAPLLWREGEGIQAEQQQKQEWKQPVQCSRRFNITIRMDNLSHANPFLVALYLY